MHAKQKEKNAITDVFNDYRKRCMGTERGRWKQCWRFSGRRNLADNFLCVRVYLKSINHFPLVLMEPVH